MAGFLADATVVVHFAALLYIGLGGFLAWRWPKAIFVHVFFAAWGVAVNAIPGLPCPLTALENYFREQQGLGHLPGGFNEYYIYGDLIPRGLLPVVMVGAIMLLIVSYVGAYVRWRRKRADPPRFPRSRTGDHPQTRPAHLGEPAHSSHAEVDPEEARAIRLPAIEGRASALPEESER